MYLKCFSENLLWMRALRHMEPAPPLTKTTTAQQNSACAVLNDGMYMLDC